CLVSPTLSSTSVSSSITVVDRYPQTLHLAADSVPLNEDRQGQQQCQRHDQQHDLGQRRLDLYEAMMMANSGNIARERRAPSREQRFQKALQEEHQQPEEQDLLIYVLQQ
ncbi:hypothetical protein BGZ83_011459, partial [Gryganskiella cystojenkinii]